MNKIAMLFIVCLIMTGCVSRLAYNKDMMSLNESIDAQNRNNAAVVKFAEVSGDVVEAITQNIVENKESIDQIDLRLDIFQKFKKAHDRRWPEGYLRKMCPESYKGLD